MKENISGILRKRWLKYRPTRMLASWCRRDDPSFSRWVMCWERLSVRQRASVCRKIAADVNRSATLPAVWYSVKGGTQMQACNCQRRTHFCYHRWQVVQCFTFLIKRARRVAIIVFIFWMAAHFCWKRGTVGMTQWNGQYIANNWSTYSFSVFHC